MKVLSLLSILFPFCMSLSAQVEIESNTIGINTTTPESTLDVRIPNPSAPSSDAGVAFPHVSVLPSSGNRLGQMVMLTADSTYNYYDGNNWVPLNNQVNYIGDLKHGLQPTDHGGWIKLDGRPISALTSSQEDAAIGLGYTDTIPNALRLLYKYDPAISVGQVGGNDSIVLTQSNLPNVMLSGNTSTDGDHSHGIATRQDNWNVRTSGPGGSVGGPSFAVDNGPLFLHHGTVSAGAHSHSVVLPLGGSAQPIPLDPRFISSNSFIFLGQ